MLPFCVHRLDNDKRRSLRRRFLKSTANAIEASRAVEPMALTSNRLGSIVEGRLARGKLHPYEFSWARNGDWTLQSQFCLRFARIAVSSDRSHWASFPDLVADHSAAFPEQQPGRVAELRYPESECAGLH